MSANGESLEQAIDACVNPEITEKSITEKDFLQKANQVRMLMKDIMPVEDDEFEVILERINARYSIKMDLGIVLEEADEHEKWFAARKQSSKMFLWERYRKYLRIRKKWGPQVIGSLDTVTDKIVDLLGDPTRTGSYLRKGLVLGDVQSGKTANYTAVCNKAADVGYKIIIVLAGSLNNLRAQTQERLDEEFVGYDSSKFFEITGKNRKVKVGVGEIEQSQDVRVISFTSKEMDFNANVLKSNNLGLSDLKGPVLLVVKKNKNILENLFQWLESNNIEAGQEHKITHPMLLIDDEADYASVDTSNKQKFEDDPTTINKCIRQLIGCFDKVTYLAYTATPFANIFIDPYDENSEYGEDLFPRDFIYLLESPSNYIGADAIFGVEDEDPDNYVSKFLVPINSAEAEEYFPFKQKKDMVIAGLPDSLKEAVGYFLLVNAIRDALGSTRTHRSMMVHVSRFTHVQNSLAQRLNEWLLDMKTNIKNYSALPVKKAEKNKSIAFLKNIWLKYNLSSITRIEWEDLLHLYLNAAVATITVETVNMDSARSLDFYGNKKNGLRVIAVGGNSLSRGLTLEGLCVSYFYRKSLGYDTLFQMGRWFGYRSGYDDLVKIWMSRKTIKWYRTINDAINELKCEIQKMDDLKLTPKEFGLKVKKDPDSLLYVTAANKSQNTGRIKRPITVSGRLLETPRLYSDSKILEDNKIAVERFLNVVVKNGELDHTQKDYYWRGISQTAVIQLIRSFKTHPWHLSYQGEALAEYIEKNIQSNWDVALVTGGEGEPYDIPAVGISVAHSARRNVFIEDDSILINGSKVKVGAGGCTKFGLTAEEISYAKNVFKKTNPKAKTLPDSAYLLQNRNPLLMIHIVQIESSEEDATLAQDLPEFVYAIGIGFPDTGVEEETADYIINMIEMRNYMNPDEENTEE